MNRGTHCLKLITFKLYAERQPAQSISMRTYKFLLSASIAASILSTVSSWFFYSRWEEVEDTHLELQKKNNELSASYEMLQTAYDSVLAELSVLHDPEFRSISLYAKDAPKKECLRIYWNPYNRKTFIEALSLPAIAEGQEYKLYCTAGRENILATTFSREIQEEHLISAGKVAAAERWMLYAAERGDTLPPATADLLLSSY